MIITVNKGKHDLHLVVEDVLVLGFESHLLQWYVLAFVEDDVEELLP